jgi:hypothetical protein
MCPMKKRISGADLSWLISEEVLGPGKRPTRAALAVVPDKDGWRVVVSNRGRRFLTAADGQRLADIQRRLRAVYDLRS